MNRRQFLTVSAASLAAPAFAQSLPVPQSETRWNVRASEGFDAIAFLGALSGGELYLEYYATEAKEFAPRLRPEVRTDLASLAKEGDASEFGLLWPTVANIMSGADISTLDDVLAALNNADSRILPPYRASPYYDDKTWSFFHMALPRLSAVFSAMRDANFMSFRDQLAGARLAQRVSEIQSELANRDVVRWQRKLTGRSFDPTIDIVLMHFSKPHGVKVQGQRFLQSADYSTEITLRIAAHEMLHPPFPLDGKVAKSAMAVLEKDELITRIVREHDRRWGYNSLDGYLNEDACQALDQLIGEAIGVARMPAERWRKADDGMHVLAAGLYGLLQRDGYPSRGGNFEQWLGNAIDAGWLAPASLHASAARIMALSVDKLWTPTEVPKT